MQQFFLQSLLKEKVCCVWCFLAILSFDFKSATATKINSPKPHTVVYIFLTEDCKICQSYTLTLKKLYQNYSGAGFEFIGVFPNASSTAATLASFQKQFAIPFQVNLDHDNAISRALGARVTPEVFVVDKAANKVLYQGRIDNTFFSLGQRRSITTTHELSEALAAIQLGKPLTIAKTEAIGCIITPRKKSSGALK
jgi:peroxiredoxin